MGPKYRHERTMTFQKQNKTQNPDFSEPEVLTVQKLCSLKLEGSCPLCEAVQSHYPG